MEISEILADRTLMFMLANGLYAVSWMMRSMLSLRIVAIAAALASMPWFWFQPATPWFELGWQLVFLAINGFGLGVLLFGMRIPHFDLIEQIVYKSKFEELEPHEVVPIFKSSRRLSLEPGEVLFNDGENNETLFLIVSGECKAVKNGQDVATLKADDFVGELSFVSDEPVSSDVVTSKHTELMCWDKSSLRPLFEKQGLYKSFFYSMCSVDIANKLRSMTAASTVSEHAEAG